MMINNGVFSSIYFICVTTNVDFQNCCSFYMLQKKIVVVAMALNKIYVK